MGLTVPSREHRETLYDALFHLAKALSRMEGSTEKRMLRAKYDAYAAHWRDTYT